MKKPICKIADIIYVRFELKEFEAQKKYLNHFGMILAHENENSIFFRGTGTSPYTRIATSSSVSMSFHSVASGATCASSRPNEKASW